MSHDIMEGINAVVNLMKYTPKEVDYTPQLLESLKWIEKNSNDRGWANYLEFANLHGKTPMPSGLVELDFPLNGTVLGAIRMTGAARMLLEAHQKLDEKQASNPG